MKRSTKLALSLVLAAGAVAPAFAQDNFPDVPANHWAYDALRRMKQDGLLVGYPDGLFRGGRPASRYELAVAMHAVYTNLKNVTDGLDAQIKALGGSQGYASQADVTALRDAVAALQADLAAMKGYGDDIAALKRAAETFDRELKSLGVDVEAMKKDLGDLATRVKRLEDKKPAVEISGDLNLLILAGSSSGDRPGLNQDGRLLGVGRTDAGVGGGTVGLQDDFNVFHEGAFTFTGTNTSGVKFTGTAVIGNMLSGDGPGTDGGFGAGTGLGSQSTLPTGRYNDGVTSDIYLQNVEAMFGAEAFGVGFDIELGRVRHKVSPYMFQRIDNTSYYSNERWDDGKYTFDGGIAKFKLFGANLVAFGGRNSERYSVNGIDLNQVVLGNNRIPGGTLLASGTSDESINVSGGATSVFDVDRSLGLQLSTPLTKVGNLNLAYLWLDSDSTIAIAGNTINRIEVYGGDADFTFGRIKLSGGYSISDFNNNSSSQLDDDNSQFHAKVAFKGNKFDLFGEYQEVEANYVAPGDWGRVGILRNLANVRGFKFGASLNINDALVISGQGSQLTGLDDTSDFSATLFDGDTTIDTFAVRLDYKLNPSLSVFGSYEDTSFNSLAGAFGANGDAEYRFSTLGLAYGLSSNAKLNLSYQFSDVKNEAFLADGDGIGNGARYKGGLLTTQLTIKF